MNQTPVVVIIATSGGYELRRTLDSLALCELPTNYRGVYVVENGKKTPGVEELVNSYSKSLTSKYRYKKKGNKSGALNSVIEELQDHCLIFFTDDDVVFERNILMAYQMASYSKRTGCVFGGKIIAETETAIPLNIKRFLPSSCVGYPPDGDTFDPKKNLFLGANFAAFSTDIKLLGGFDMNYGPGSALGASGQESDMLIRMRENNYDFKFVPGAIVKHFVDQKSFDWQFIEHRKYRNGIQSGIRFKIKMHKQMPSWKSKRRIAFHRISKLGMYFPFRYNLDMRMKASFSRGFLFGFYSEIQPKDL